MKRNVTPANGYLAQYGIKMGDIAIVAGVSGTTISLASAGEFRVSDRLAEAVFKVLRISGMTISEATEVRDHWLSLCHGAWLERHPEKVTS